MSDAEKIRQEVTQDELAAAFAGPAPGANKFYITIGQPGVRIAFCELIPNTMTPLLRAAVTLHPADAIQLHKVLAEMLAGIEKQFLAVQVPPTGDAGTGDAGEKDG